MTDRPTRKQKMLLRIRNLALLMTVAITGLCVESLAFRMQIFQTFALGVAAAGLVTLTVLLAQAVKLDD